MKPKDLARAIRDGTGTFLIDKVIVADTTGTVKFRGIGLFRITSDGITAELFLRGKAAPDPKRVLTEKDYWTLRGVIAGDLPFSSAYITPIARLGPPKQKFHVTRTLAAIELINAKVDPIRIRSQNRARYRRLKIAPPPRSKPGSDRSFLFRATFVDHPLPGANEGTEKLRTNPFLPDSKKISGDTFLGETADAEYALIRAANERDLELHFRSKPHWKSPGQQDDQRKFEALLYALAFCSGIQPWPYRTTYSRGKGFVISDVFNAAVPPPRTEFVPLRVNIGKEAGVELARAIGRAAEFFEQESQLTQKVRDMLFLFRQAGSAQPEIASLTVCMLLESLLRAIFKYACEGKSTAVDALSKAKFDKLRTSFLRRVNTRRADSSKGPEFQRLCTGITGAQMFNIRDVFQAVSSHLGIRWKDEMEPIFREWKKARNPLVHGQTSHLSAASTEEQAGEGMFHSLSRIAGGFNMILLRLFGYTGSYLASVLEGKRSSIEERDSPANKEHSAPAPGLQTV